jgi:hypothetical protein
MATTNSLLLGKHIYKILSESEAISGYVGNKIFPIVVESGTKYPFIVFTRSSIDTSFSKDGIIKDIVKVEINCVTATYLDGCIIANEVRNLLDCSTYKTEELFISQIRLSNVVEAYQDDAYIQTLTFDFHIK